MPDHLVKVMVQMLTAMETFIEWDDDSPGVSCRWCAAIKGGRKLSLDHEDDCILVDAQKALGVRKGSR